MSDKVFDLLCDSLRAYSKENRPKNIRLAGLGEPLINKKCPEMIKELKNYTQEVVLFTNGTLLDEKISEALIISGVDVVRISLNGMSSENYLELSQTAIDFDGVLKNIEYIHSIRNSTKIYIKIPDIALSTPKLRHECNEMFSPICDALVVEDIVPIYPDVDYAEMDLNLNKTVEGDMITDVKVCPQPFYQLTINSDGTAAACCVDSTNQMIVGNIAENGLDTIWNGFCINKLRKDLLIGSLSKDCKMCNYRKYAVKPHDNIDSVSEKLLQYYSNEATMKGNRYG